MVMILLRKRSAAMRKFLRKPRCQFDARLTNIDAPNINEREQNPMFRSLRVVESKLLKDKNACSSICKRGRSPPPPPTILLLNTKSKRCLPLKRK